MCWPSVIRSIATLTDGKKATVRGILSGQRWPGWRRDPVPADTVRAARASRQASASESDDTVRLVGENRDLQEISPLHRTASLKTGADALKGGHFSWGGFDSGMEELATATVEEPPFAVVAPAYNESLVIGSVVLLAKKHADRVIVVDDGSADRTAEIARLAGADVVKMPQNGGKAKAMMAGFARARELGYNAVVMLDGDGQHDPEEIPIVAAPVLAGEADLVIGSRFLDIKAEIPKYRLAGQKVLNGLTNLSVDGGFATTDSQSGFRALSCRALENLTFASEGYNIESDMIAHFAPLNLRMTEVPISVTYDVPHKHKKNPLSHGFGVLAKIMELIGYKRPLLFFGIPGMILTTIGISLEIFTFSEFYRIDQFHYIVFTLGITALILGLLLVSSGLILNSLMLVIQRHVYDGV